MFTNRFSTTMIIVLVLAIALVTASFITHSGTVAAADRSYDSIEKVRALPDSPSGYEQVEALRLQRGVSFSSVDSSYDLVERVRLARTYSADDSYAQIESIRLGR